MYSGKWENKTKMASQSYSYNHGGGSSWPLLSRLAFSLPESGTSWPHSGRKDALTRVATISRRATAARRCSKIAAQRGSSLKRARCSVTSNGTKSSDIERTTLDSDVSQEEKGRSLGAWNLHNHDNVSQTRRGNFGGGRGKPRAASVTSIRNEIVVLESFRR